MIDELNLVMRYVSITMKTSQDQRILTMKEKIHQSLETILNVLII